MPLFRTDKWYSVELCRANPNLTFVFGDNTMRMGKGGQAIIRDEPNALGLATKRAPSELEGAFFENNDLDDLWEMVSDLNDVLTFALSNDVVIPFTNRVELGTGLSELPESAPKLYALLQLVFTEDMPVAELNDG